MDEKVGQSFDIRRAPLGLETRGIGRFVKLGRLAAKRGRPRGFVHVAALSMVLVAACGSPGETAATETETTPTSQATSTTTSTTEATTTTTVATTTTLSAEELGRLELEADTKLIQQLWRAHSDVHTAGLSEVYAYSAERNHPAMGCTAEDFETYYAFPEGFSSESVVLPETVEPDPGWKMLSGDAVGTVPEGRVYIYSMLTSASVPGEATQPQERIEVHAAILDGEAFFFINCGR